MADQSLYEQAKYCMPGGVNSPVRSFSAVGGNPIFMQSAQGAYLQDTEHRSYIDYVNGFGPHILGHSHPDIIRAITESVQLATSFGACHPFEVEMAELLIDSVPCVEMVRLVNSGTEAAMSAIRLARGVTGRDHILKFSGGYHGHVDALLVKAGSGATTHGQPSSAGIGTDLSAKTHVAEYNNLTSVDAILAEFGDQISSIIVEPVAGNMGLILPEPGFLAGLKLRAERYGIILIFDEVMTGFRVDFGGAQSLYGIQPDLCILGKIIGGGLPVGAIGGSRALMSEFAPTGPVYQAGTLSGNPVTLAAGLACLRFCKKNQSTLYPHLRQQTKTLTSSMMQLASTHKLPLQVAACGGMFGFFFADNPVRHYNDALQCRQDYYQKFFHYTLNRGLYFAPSAFEASFVSFAHDDNTLQHTINTIDEVFAILAKDASHLNSRTREREYNT